MSRWIRVAITSALLSIVAPIVHAFDAAMAPVTAQGSLQAAFAPWDDIESLITHAIDGAQKQVLVQAYLLTNTKVAAAKTDSSKLSVLAAAGIAVGLETKYQNAHNKIIVIDAATLDAIVITGSFNFTWTAQHKNAENILIARKNSPLASRYALNWERHRQDAAPYKK